jgi:hypothetical protein
VHCRLPRETSFLAFGKEDDHPPQLLHQHFRFLVKSLPSTH